MSVHQGSINGHLVEAFMDTGCNGLMMTCECAQRCDILSSMIEDSKILVCGLGEGAAWSEIPLFPVEISGYRFSHRFVIQNDPSRENCCLGMSF